MADIVQLTQSPEQYADGLVKAAKETPHVNLTAIAKAFLHAAVQLLVEECGVEPTRDCLLQIADNIMMFPANDKA